MSKPEIQVVREWLVREGYPLEYETAREMTRAGYRAWQGRYYVDAEDKTYRELDVRADEPDSLDAPWRPVYVVAECKNNSKPWLVLTERHELQPGYGTHFLIQRGVTQAELEAAARPDAGFLLNVPARHGYSVIQAIAGGDSAHAALHAVSKAALGSVAGFGQAQPAVAIPVIVLGGALYQLGYNDDGTEILEPVLWQRVVWFGSSAKRESIQIDVVTRDYLPMYLQQLRPATRRLASVLGELARK